MFQEYLIPGIIQILEKGKKKTHYRINWTRRRIQKESTREKCVLIFQGALKSNTEKLNPPLHKHFLQISSEVGSIKYKHQLNKWASLVAMQENWVRSLGWEDLLEKGMATTIAFLPREFHRQRSLAGYNPPGHKESDTTQWLTLSTISSLVKIYHNLQSQHDWATEQENEFWLLFYFNW